MKAILLRIGIDSNYGALSPVWDDMSYIYFPIYNKNIKEIERGETRTYEDLFGDNTKYLPDKIHKKIVHLDPEFETFTYGDVKNKSKILSTLEKGDLLVFYMGGIMQNDSSEKGCFIIGYLDVQSVFVSGNKYLTNYDLNQIRNEFPNNAHSISSKTQQNLVIIKGSDRSRKLDRCIKLTDKNNVASNPSYITKTEYQIELGIRRFIIRAVPVKISDNKKLEKLKHLLAINF
ncbi:hypothetical protein [Flavobacterium filum]|uniref:Nmad3 family putative nucleotide modification protein n=1 Tax=Flavobacterium filum TaxID=370974 RepID=UPI0023F01F5C|nr:hypothetical protein [Flavobacterium filum]